MWLTSAPSSQWSKLSVGWNCCCLSWAVVFAISIAAIKLLERKIHIYSFILFLEKTPTYLSVVLKVADCLAWACYNLSIVTVVNFTIWTSASQFSLSGRISAWASCPILTFKSLQSQDFNITNVVIPIVVPLLDTCRLGLYLIFKFIVILELRKVGEKYLSFVTIIIHFLSFYQIFFWCEAAKCKQRYKNYK